MVIETRITQGETRKGAIAQFSVLETIFWASLCTLAFNVLLLRDSGFTSVEVGLMMAINNVVAIIAPIIWGYLADRFNRIKTLFLIANVLVMFSTLVLPFCADRTVLGVPLIAVTMAVFQMARILCSMLGLSACATSGRANGFIPIFACGVRSDMHSSRCC